MTGWLLTSRILLFLHFSKFTLLLFVGFFYQSFVSLFVPRFCSEIFLFCFCFVVFVSFCLPPSPFLLDFFFFPLILSFCLFAAS